MNILPLFPFGPVRWWQLASEKGACVDAGEHFVHQTLRNRYWILSPNGPQCLTIPVQGQKGIKFPVSKILLSEEIPWRRIHSGAIRAAYGKSAFYIHIIDELNDLFVDRSITTLCAFSLRTISLIEPFTGRLPATISEKYVQPAEGINDYRHLFGRTPVPSLQPAYPQVFSDRFGFVDGLSILDRIMNLGS